MDDFFDRWAWLYALCRERLFTDHTELIMGIMHARVAPVEKPIFMEVGCGPGFYSIAIAQRFPQWHFVGLDCSNRLLQRARGKAASKSVENCTFAHGDVTCASDFPLQVDFLLASRLLFILPDRPSALHAMHAGLRPGGTLLIAEPLPGWRSRLALRAVRALRRFGSVPFPCSAAEPQAMAECELSMLINSYEWSLAQGWSDRRYQYYLCEKPLQQQLPVEKMASFVLHGPSAHTNSQHSRAPYTLKAS